MKNQFINALLLSLCLLTPLPSMAGSYDKMFVFGDSLSDTGNLALLSLVSPDAAEFKYLNDPPYKTGFTNGPTAVVKLAELLGLPTLTPALYFTPRLEGNNFAVAGARAAAASDDPIGLNAQVGAFLASQDGKAPSDALYILFIGGNDIRDMRNASSNKAAYEVLNKAIHNIHNSLSLLLASGARYFMVVNSPDIGNIPETRYIAESTHNRHLIQRASFFTQAYNKSLAETAMKIEKTTGANLVMFDVFSFFKKIVGESRSLLFANAKDACYLSDRSTYNTVCSESQLDAFVYFDEIHPSRRVHERVGRAMFALAPGAN